MSEYFEQTDYGLYDRHHYKLIYSNGKTKIFDDYHSLREEWYNKPKKLLDYVEVVDKKEKTQTKGFK